MKKRFLVVAAVACFSALHAQVEPAKNLEEVSVTATKFSKKLSETGKVVTIITKEDLEKAGGKSLAQILTEQAGIYIGGANSNAGKDKNLYLRGARVDHTLITIDGVPVYDASGIGSNFDIRNITLSQIERIEILKGSQSTLYGSDAIAGVINIITKKGGTRPLGAQAGIGYGSNDTWQADAGIQGKTGAVDYNLGYSFFDTKGINETVSNNGDKDGFNQHNFQAGLGVQAGQNTRIQPYFRYSKINGDIDQGAFTDELDYTYTQKSWQAGIRNEIQFGTTKLNILYSYNNIDRLYIDDSIKSRNGFDTYSRGSYKGKEHFIDAYFTTPFGNIFKLTAGADFRSSGSDQEYHSVSAWPSSSRYGSDSLKQHQTGLYAALNINTNTNFNLELGNRFNIHSVYGVNDVFNINPSYLLNKKLKLFANVSSAYRTPSLYQLFSEYGNKELKPEAAITVEGGLQYFAANDKVNSRITIFSRNVKDIIFFYFNPDTYQSQYINQDKQKDHGVEFEISYKPISKFSLKAFYSFVDGEITTQQNGKDTSYFNLLRRPKHSAGINMGYEITSRIFASSNIAWYDARKDAFFDATTYETVNLTLKSYTLWDVYTEYRFTKNQLKAFVQVNNILDTDYNEVAGYSSLGRTFSAGLRFRL